VALPFARVSAPHHGGGTFDNIREIEHPMHAAAAPDAKGDV